MTVRRIGDERPRLSVVVPCYDAVGVLAVQLAALARQDCSEPWELIVADNGSTDGTPALARAWADRLPLRVIEAGSVRGAGPARNAAALAARGDWLAFCDADDEVGPGWLAAVCRALGDHPFVAGRFDYARLNSRRVRRSRTPDQQAGLQHSCDVVALPHAGAGNLAIRRAVFLEVGGFDPQVRYLQDTDLCWRVQLAGFPLTFVPEMLVHVRLRATLRGMYRQGRNYGASQARLERRYTVPGGDSTVLSTSRPERPLRRLGRLLRWAVTQRVTVGGLVWQFGWHRGRRAAQAAAGAVPRGRAACT